jgi:tetratricopeptide (TPR) repeat protein
MTTGQILTVSAVVLLIAGIATTLSRAGITAALLGLVAFFLSRVAVGRWYAVFFSLTVIVSVSVLFLSLMDLDTIILTELQTLKDPVSESTGRLLHWSDSLRSCLDFPLIGSGVASYRCASMPYQRHYTGKWFQRADNHYVEVLVESGVLGFACFIGVGILGVVLAIRTLTSRHRRQGLETIFAGWLASSVILGMTALSGAAFFDYGVSLPSVAAGILAISALLENQFHNAGKPGFGARPSGRRWLELSGNSVFLLWLSLIGSAVILLPDTAAAAESYSAVAAAERQLGKPAVETLEESGDWLLQQLDKALGKRPDDILVARVRLLLLEQLCRRELLLQSTKGQVLDQQALQDRFQAMRPGVFAFYLQNPAVPEEVADQVRAEFSSCLRKYSWGETGKALMKRSVGLPSVGLMMMEFGVIFSDLPCQEAAMQYTQFCEPQDAPGLFEIGQLTLRDGRTDDARRVWELSLRASEQFRSRMISELARTATIEQSLSWLMPDQYESSVQCAIEMRGEPALREKLLERAEQIWKISAPRMTDAVAISRSRHLEEIGSVEAGLQVLELYLYEDPHNLSVRKALASLLEKVGRNGEAYDEWLRIQSFDPDDSSVPVALERLIKLPPTSGN